jgi:hypothetical protein
LADCVENILKQTVRHRPWIAAPNPPALTPDSQTPYHQPTGLSRSRRSISCSTASLPPAASAPLPCVALPPRAGQLIRNSLLENCISDCQPETPSGSPA